MTLVVLAMIASVAVIATSRVQSPAPADPATIVSESLQVAIEESRSITFGVLVHDALVDATVHFDGAVVADSAIHLEALTGRPTDAH
jgi:hypothetical protein